jgi:hypothetical protein
MTESQIKKISISLFGRIYGTHQQFDFHKIVQSIYPEAQIDIYIHCWKYDSFNNKKYENKINEIQEYFNPKKIIVDDLEKVNTEGMNTCIYMLYSIQQSMSISVSENIDYDLCLCVRPDIIMNQTPKFDNIVLEDNVVNMYSCPSFAISSCSGICDWLYAGNMKTFTSIATIHNSIKLNVSNETNIYNNFINNGISIKTIGTINGGEIAIVNKELLFAI